jgi:predicted CXXCH cytochrome family protein
MSECVACHADKSKVAESLVVAGFDKSSHGKNELTCMSCHFRADYKADDNSLCLKCHTALAAKAGLPYRKDLVTKACSDCHTDAFLFKPNLRWRHPYLSHHADLACTRCHAPHGSDRRADLVQNPPALCYACHKDVSNQFVRMSHHPINEGRISCSDCHSIHSPDWAQLRYQDFRFYGAPQFRFPDPERYNQACLKCHNYLLLTGLGVSGFSIKNTENLHQVHLDRAYAACTDCHVPHGSQWTHLMADTADNGALIYVQRGTGGSCTVICHSFVHTNLAYGQY